MTSGSGGQFARLLDLIAELDRNGVVHQLQASRPDALMVRVLLPDQHWEVEFLLGGAVRVERFDPAEPLDPVEGLRRLTETIADYR